jgi:hypothetical protein
VELPRVRVCAATLVLAASVAGCSEIQALLPAPSFAGVVPPGLTCLGVAQDVCEVQATGVGWRKGNELLVGVVIVCVDTDRVCDRAHGIADIHLLLTDGSTDHLIADWDGHTSGLRDVDEQEGP